MFFSTDSESPMNTEHWKSEKPLGLFCLGCSTLQHTVSKNQVFSTELCNKEKKKYHLTFGKKIQITVCCRVEQPKQKIPRGFSLFQSKVFIGDSESVEKNILQQTPLGVTS